MLIVALVLAVIGLAALVTAVVTSNELIAWVCFAASVIGVVLLIVDALRERSRADADVPSQEADEDYVEDYPEEPTADVDDETAEAPTETVDSDASEVAEEDSNPR
jgi:heme exporter protein D